MVCQPGQVPDRAFDPSDPSRRSVVPQAANHSLWLAAIWTGVGAAVVCAVTAIVTVAVCWLPVSGPNTHSMSAVRAGLLTFLAALHGGVTIDGTPAAFVPLGLTLIVGAVAWRAGSGLGDAAASLDEREPARLATAAALQAASFTVAALITIPFARLGTSSAPVLGVAGAGLLLFLATGGVAFVRTSELAGWCAVRVPPVVPGALRAAGAALAVYVGMGAFLLACSLVAHHGRVEAISRQVGGGWGGIPVLLLGALAAPNAAIAGASYLAGPGFAIGAGSGISPFTTSHAVVPAFPILGALPSGHGANAFGWLLAAITPLVAGGCVARLVLRAEGWPRRCAEAVTAAGALLVAMVVLGWQAGGGIGTGGLRTIGPSPLLFGLAAAAAVLAATALWLGVAAGSARVRSRGLDRGAGRLASHGPEPAGPASLARRLFVVATGRADDASGEDQLAG
ncbi:MAG: hypothetical protein QOE97_293 [Pseudonocardiales bacterium]|nr:hypothetical protein [Pseudonocardiales bacterium]